MSTIGDRSKNTPQQRLSITSRHAKARVSVAHVLQLHFGAQDVAAQALDGGVSERRGKLKAVTIVRSPQQETRQHPAFRRAISRVLAPAQTDRGHIIRQLRLQEFLRVVAAAMNEREVRKVAQNR